MDFRFWILEWGRGNKLVPSLCLLIATVIASVFIAPISFAAEISQKNIASLARISVSDEYQEFKKELAIDGDINTRWGNTPNPGKPQWVQLNWNESHRICGIVLYQPHSYDIVFDVQVEQDGKWETVARSGQPGKAQPLKIVVLFEPQETKSLKLAISERGATFQEVEVYEDPQVMKTLMQEAGSMHISVAGDLRGHLIGTVSRDKGMAGVEGAEVRVTGRNPLTMWKRSTKTGENGFFSVDMDPASMGEIKITASDSVSSSEITTDSGDIAGVLTPRPAGKKQRISLDGTWDFTTDPPTDWMLQSSKMEWSKIKVPAHWEMEGFNSRNGLGLYKKTFSIPKDWNGRRIKLRAEAIYSHAEIWVNGKKIGSHEGGATPFELDITDAVKQGTQNEMMILVKSRSLSSNFDRMSYFAYFEMAGIWRSIEVFAVEPLHVSRIVATTDFDPSYKDAELKVELDIANERSVGVTDAGLDLRVTDPKGRELRLEALSTSVSLDPWQTKSLTLKAKVVSPEQWNAEQPKLYKLQTKLSARDQRVELIEQSFGFREVEIKGRTFMVNGKPVKFWGVSRLDADPLHGRTMSPETNRKDIEMMKQANFNALRVCVIPSDPYTYDLTDETGIYVENDAAACFVWDGAWSADLRNAPYLISCMSEFVERDRNHPSVVIWSLANESAFGRGFQMAYQFTRASDPTRPCTTGQSGGLELVTYHCPLSMQRLKDTAESSMPVLNDEGFPIFHGWDFSPILELDPGLRDYWPTGMPEVMDAVRASDYFIGCMQFSWVDDAFLVPGREIGYWRSGYSPLHFNDRVYKLPGRGIIGDYAWGTVDGWRRPRPEWWLSKKLYSPVKIEEKPLVPPTQGQPIVVSVKNMNTFMNLDQYTCKWRLGDEKGDLRPDVPSQSTGAITILPRKSLTPDDVLVLEFYDECSRLVDGYKLAFKPHEAEALPHSGNPAEVDLELEPPDFTTGRYLNGVTLARLIGSGCELAWNRQNSRMVRGVVGKELVLTSGPNLHILAQDGKEPCAAGGSLSRITGNSEHGWGVFTWDAEYTAGLKGGFQVRMDDAADIEISYSFTYSGPEFNAREIGLSFELPLDMDTLEWDRRSEWSYYPDDHIGRPHGKASVHPDVPQNTPPGDRPYALDDHPWGCNDFRSTKRGIYSAKLTNKLGAGVRIFSDGSQSVRATIGLHSMSMKVLDHYGGSPTTANEWQGLYGAGHSIKPGDVIKGVVRLQLLPQTGKQKRFAESIKTLQ